MDMVIIRTCVCVSDLYVLGSWYGCHLRGRGGGGACLWFGRQGSVYFLDELHSTESGPFFMNTTRSSSLSPSISPRYLTQPDIVLVSG
jgi:hypothetical protein